MVSGVSGVSRGCRLFRESFQGLFIHVDIPDADGVVG